MRLSIFIAALAGLGLAAYFILSVGAGAIFSQALSVGWSGFAILCLYTLALFAILGAAWFALMPADCALGLPAFIWGRAVRESAAEVLPFSQVGGLVFGAHAMILRGMTAPLAFASTIADVTTEMLAQIVFLAIGIVILVARVPATASKSSLVNGVTLGILLAALGAAVFLLVQKQGFAVLARLASRFLPRAAAQARAVHTSLAQIHAAPLRLFLSFAIHLGGWLASAFWAWLAIHFIGVRVQFISVFAIEALLFAVRSTAVFVPNAIGVQEAAYAMLVPLFGLAPQVGLAVSLLKRARDVAIGVPLLVAWQAAEGGRALKSKLEAERLLANE